MISFAMIGHLFFIAVLLSIGALVNAQPTICSCAPTHFTFRLDFSRTCQDNTVPIGKTHGIDRSYCRTDDVDSNDEDEQAPAAVVVQLTSVLILELDFSLHVTKQHFRDGLDLVNGQLLEYQSIVADHDGGSSGGDDDNTVAAIQMALSGVTADGTSIQSQFILTYTNLCGTDVFRVGDAISWLVVDGITPAPDDVCLAGALPNEATSASSSNDIPPDLVEPDALNAPGDIDRSGVAQGEPISLSMRRLDLNWQDLLDGYSGGEEEEGGDGHLKKKGGLDKRLRRRIGKTV